MKRKGICRRADGGVDYSVVGKDRQMEEAVQPESSLMKQRRRKRREERSLRRARRHRAGVRQRVVNEAAPEAISTKGVDSE